MSIPSCYLILFLRILDVVLEFTPLLSRLLKLRLEKRCNNNML